MSLTLNVRFDQDGSESHSKGGPQADSPTIFGEGKVCGVIELHGEVKAGDSGFVELVLDGQMKVSMDFLPDPNVYPMAVTTTRPHELLSMTTTTPVKDFQRAESTKDGKDFLWAPFFFQLPTSSHMPSECLSTCCSKDHSKHALPPSLKLKGQQGSRSSAKRSAALRLRSCDVKYSVNATLWNDETEPTQASKEWNYMPITRDAPPPVTVVDFPGEYQLFSKTLATDLRRLKTYGHLSVEMEEPYPVLIEAGDIGSVKAVGIGANMRLYPVVGGMNRSEMPDILECECTFSLETDTFFSTNCQGATLPRANRIPPLVVSQQQKQEPQRRRIPISSWHESIDENGPHWQAKADLTFYLQCKDSLLPTFSLGFVSLRHALGMNLKLFNRRGHTAASSLDLRSPIQIGYSSASQDPADCPSYEAHIFSQRNDLDSCSSSAAGTGDFGHAVQPPMYTKQQS